MDNKESGVLIIDVDIVNTIVKEKHDLFIESFPGKEFQYFNFILLIKHLIKKAAKNNSFPITRVILLHLRLWIT